MITIDQLLESVDLDFEPRWVTKDENGEVCIFENAPETCEQTKQWVTTVFASGLAGYEGLKLAEFENKPWAECIYEVPRKTTGKIEKLDGEFKAVLFPGLEAFCITSEAFGRLTSKINEIIDWINDNHKDFK